VELLGEPEVEHLDGAALVDDDVRGLDVAVDDAVAVRLAERLGRLARDLDGARNREPRPGQNVAERLPRDQLHHDEGLAFRGLAEVVDGGDVRVAELGDGACLSQEAGAVVVLVLPRVRNLDGDAAAEQGVLGHVDHTHASLADLAEDAVVRNGLADHRSRGRLGRCGTKGKGVSGRGATATRRRSQS
jgi:hypothetical protein